MRRLLTRRWPTGLVLTAVALVVGLSLAARHRAAGRLLPAAQLTESGGVPVPVGLAGLLVLSVVLVGVLGLRQRRAHTRHRD